MMVCFAGLHEEMIGILRIDNVAAVPTAAQSSSSSLSADANIADSDSHDSSDWQQVVTGRKHHTARQQVSIGSAIQTTICMVMYD